MIQNHHKLMTPGDVAKRIGVHPKTVTRWANEGKLPVGEVTIGGHRRYRRDVVEEIAQRLKAQANHAGEIPDA